MTNTSVKNIHRLIAVMLIALLGCAAAEAQKQSRKPLTSEQRQKALGEMRNFKHNMLIRELDLSKDQQAKFFDLYDQMDDELMAINSETRDLERKTINDASATDNELNAAARAMYEQKQREAEVELRYFDKFADVLSPRQLVKLKGAERKIALRMASFHARSRNKNKSNSGN